MNKVKLWIMYVVGWLDISHLAEPLLPLLQTTSSAHRMRSDNIKNGSSTLDATWVSHLVALMSPTGVHQQLNVLYQPVDLNLDIRLLHCHPQPREGVGALPFYNWDAHDHNGRHTKIRCQQANSTFIFLLATFSPRAGGICCTLCCVEASDSLP